MTKAAGASKSLNRTITEIMAFLNDEAAWPSRRLRPFLHEKLDELSDHFFKRGFRRGCIESRKIYRGTGRFPDRVDYGAKRVLFAGNARHISVAWKKRKCKLHLKGTPLSYAQCYIQST